MAQTADKPFESKTYFVRERERQVCGYFTVTPEIGLLQVTGDFGTYAHQWHTPGMDFRQFLIQTTNAPYKFETNLRADGLVTNRMAEQRLKAHLHDLMALLWPLFIEKLKAELAPAPTEEASADDRTWYPVKRVAVTVDVDGYTAEVSMADFEDGGRKVWAMLEDRAAQIAQIAAGQLKEMAPDLPYSPSDPEVDEAQQFTPTIQGDGEEGLANGQ